MSTESNGRCATAQREPVAQRSILIRLQLTAEHWESLARQGYVTEDRRGPNKCVFKLRFRHQGRVVVRYLSTDPAVAEAARRELAEIQREARTECNLRRLLRRARRALRAAKARSTPALNAMGFAYHGYQLRRPKAARSNLAPIPQRGCES